MSDYQKELDEHQAGLTSKTRHTPGPYEVTYHENGRLREIETVAKKDGRYRHLTNQLPYGAEPGELRDEAGNSSEMVATAELFASAPDLLADNERLRAAARRVRDISAEMRGSGREGTFGLGLYETVNPVLEALGVASWEKEQTEIEQLRDRVEGMGKVIDQLTSENERLTKTVSRLQVENMRLLNENERLRSGAVSVVSGQLKAENERLAAQLGEIDLAHHELKSQLATLREALREAGTTLLCAALADSAEKGEG